MHLWTRLFGRKRSKASDDLRVTTVARAIESGDAEQAYQLLRQIQSAYEAGPPINFTAVSVDVSHCQDGLVWLAFGLKVFEGAGIKRLAERFIATLNDGDGKGACEIDMIIICLLAVVIFIRNYPDQAQEHDYYAKIAPISNVLAKALPEDKFPFLY